MRIYISSLKFSAAHMSHMIAYAKLFEYLGHNPIFWLDKGYQKMIVEQETFPTVWYTGMVPTDAEAVLLYNPSVSNSKVSKKLERHGLKLLYVYHEPWESFQQRLKEGLKQALKAFVAHYYSTRVLKYADIVIVPSNCALKLYNKSDEKYNKNVIMIPLLFDDELTSTLDISKKEYFSYIGRAFKGHSFDMYISLIKWIYTSGSNMKFEIATGTDIGKIVNSDGIIRKMINSGVLNVSHDRPLTNAEINQAYERSFCVWNVYRRSTQSGVLPKAFMFGTPVIASNIGSFPEFVRDGENGYLIDDYDPTGVYKKVLLIKDNIESLSKHCREKFESTFYWKSQVSKMEELLARIL